MSKYTTQTNTLQQDAEINLKKHMMSNGLPCDKDIIWDGNVHRYGSKTNKDTSEWYIATQLSDDKFICTYASWKSQDNKFTFRSYDKLNFPEEKNILESFSNKILIEEKISSDKNTKDVLSLWNALPSGGSHQYLESKNLPFLNVKVKDDYLYVPLYDLDNNLKSLQKIFPDKSKRFYTGISSKGLIHPIGHLEESQDIYVCEGYATGLSVYLSTDSYTVVAFSGSQVVSVGLMLANRYPSKKIKLAADNDTVGNAEALKWKNTVSPYVYFPKNKDFNDDWVALGKEKVRDIFYPKISGKSLFKICNEEVKEDQKLNDVIFEGSVAIIFGDAGVGKSRVVTEMAFCLALEERFLSFKAHKKARVLLLDGEMSDWDIQSRTKELLLRYQDCEKDLKEEDFCILNNNDFKKEYDQDINLYNATHREIIGRVFNDFDILILDNFNSLSSATGPVSDSAIYQKKQDWKQLFLWLKTFRNLGKTTIIVAHSTKDKTDLQGVSEMKADANTILQIRAPNTPPTGESYKSQGNILLDFVIEYSKARNIPQYLQRPIRATLLSDRNVAYGWKYDFVKPGSKE